MNTERLLIRGFLCGAIASLILWLVLSGTVLFFRRAHPDLFILLVGLPLWGITWAVAGTVISAIAAKSGRWKSVGTVSGVVVGLLSGGLVIVWPTCNYENVMDKAWWAVPYALLTPSLSILVPLNGLFQHVISGWLTDSAVVLISSVIFWGVFGGMLGKLIGRSASIR